MGQVNTLKRTSPSAGGFHPIQAYPVITGVDELDPGSITTTELTTRSSC